MNTRITDEINILDKFIDSMINSKEINIECYYHYIIINLLYNSYDEELLDEYILSDYKIDNVVVKLIYEYINLIDTYNLDCFYVKYYLGMIIQHIIKCRMIINNCKKRKIDNSENTTCKKTKS